ncbi:MAG: redoxin domain-containing protein [Candidatus Bathyarchaeia archaeon]|jgi:peroxiredoxin
MSSKIKVGEKAPDFTLPDTDKNPRSLNEFLGKKIVLAFFVRTTGNV